MILNDIFIGPKFAFKNVPQVVSRENKIMKKIVLGCLLAMGATSATAGVIRHDRDDADYLALAQEAQFAPTGRILSTTDAGRWICSGTLIDYSYVLTAAHCIDEDSRRDIDFLVGGETYSGARWSVHENWDPTGSLFAGWDIGIIKLDRGVYNVATASLYTGTDEIGEIGTHVGYGATGTGLNGQTEGAGTRRAGHNEIDEVNLAGEGHDRILWNDFDAPAGTDLADMLPGTIGDLGFLTNPIAGFGGVSGTALDMEYLIGGGDSGGGYYLEENGEWFLAGVHSFGASIDSGPDSTYGDLSGSTRVSSFGNWIAQTQAVLAVPEPTSIMLFGTALLGLAGFRRKAKKA